METTSPPLALASEHGSRRSRAGAGVWRKLAPVHGLLFLISFYLVLSLGYIIFYSQTFRLGKRIVVLHLAVVCGLILATVLCIGLLLLFRRFREWRFARFLVSLVPAAGYSALVTLYFVDYIANKMWGNNVTYELAAQYILGGGLFQKELQMLPGQVYLFWIGVLIVIFSVHARLSAPLFSSLKALFLPGEGPAVFRRALSAAAAISLSLFFIGFIGFQLTRAEPRYRDRIISREPVLGFFIDSRGLIEFADVRKNLAAAEAGIRKSYPSGQPFEKKNVVVILVDSLRADRMQIYGYERPTTPFLKSLVETGHIKQVEIATSTCSDTICGVLSILSSHTLGRQTPQNFKLQDLLHDQGYNVYFILSSNHSWYSLKKSYGTSLTYFFDGTRSERYQWSDDRVIFEGLEGVPDYTDTPAFFYFHLMSPHPAGVKHEEYSKYQPARNWVEFSGGDYDVVSSNNYYDNGVLQADATIKGIFESLKQKGYLDNSLVIVVADHGEGLSQAERSSYGHANSLYQECIRIPLLIYDDDARGRYADLKYATQIDVAPTIVDRLGLAIPSSWEGRSLLARDVERYSFHQTATDDPAYAIIYRTGGVIYKYLRQPGAREELYELVSDPGERHNLIGMADPSVISRMRQKLAENLPNP